MTVGLVFETHATTLDNERGIATGWLPGELSTTGRAQAAELGARRRDDGIAAVYVSDLARAVETARVAFAGTAVPIRLDARLRETDYGALNGAPVERLERLRHLDEPYPGGESWRLAVERHRGLLAELARRHDGERILLIAHSATRFALPHLLEGIPLERLLVAEFCWRPGWEFAVDATRVADRL